MDREMEREMSNRTERMKNEQGQNDGMEAHDKRWRDQQKERERERRTHST